MTASTEAATPAARVAFVSLVFEISPNGGALTDLEGDLEEYAAMAASALLALTLLFPLTSGPAFRRFAHR